MEEQQYAFRWVVLALLFLSLFAATIAMQCIPPLFSEITEQIPLTKAQRGTITALGIPEERPGNLCKLRGVGKIYDDFYEIDKLSHVYAPGSWEMTLVVHREGAVLKTGEQSETAEGQMGN